MPNADGVITPSEITPRHGGRVQGFDVAGIRSRDLDSFQLFRNLLSINVLMDYRGKFWNSYTIGAESMCLGQELRDP